MRTAQIGPDLRLLRNSLPQRKPVAGPYIAEGAGGGGGGAAPARKTNFLFLTQCLILLGYFLKLYWSALKKTD